MSVFIRSTARGSAQRARWRSVIAVGIVAGLATIGVTAIATPAAAEEAGAAVAEATTSAGDPAGPGEPPGQEKKGDPAAPEDTGEPAAPEDTGEPAVPEDTGESAAPEDTPTAPTDESASAATTEESPEATAVPLLVPPGDEVVPKVEICHATASYKHPYEINEPAADGDVSGHADHTGPIFWPDIPKHTAWGDIIPPFFYGDPANPSFFPGLNWTPEGEAIFANDCEIPTPEPDLFVFPEGCRFYLDFGTLEVEVGPVQENVEYRVTILDSEGNLAADGFISEETGTVSLFWILPPGDYTITLEQSIIEGEWELLDEQAFTIFPCPVLDVTVTTDNCSTGNDGHAIVVFTGLIEGEVYDFSVDGPDDYRIFGGFIADAPSSEVELGSAPPGDFTASITWVPGPGAELLDPVVATTTFTIEPCPAPAAKPVKPAGIAVTGTDPAPFLSAALLLFGLGGATLLAASRRRAGSSRTD
jgi:hypothetical protein